jgi:tRNA pseudouridine65 synthase
MKIKIVAEEKDWIAVAKPPHWVTYGEEAGARSLLQELGKFKGKVFPVHRLDKDTCGLVLFARSAGSASQLAALFKQRVVKKKYLAIVHGHPPEKGSVEVPLENRKEKKLEDAQTDFERIAIASVIWEGENREYALVRCSPKTGRFHQIRRHLKSLGHPIVGDPEYGNSWNNEQFALRWKTDRTLLSAIQLDFPDRQKQRMIRLKCEPAKDFLEVVKNLGWKLS